MFTKACCNSYIWLISSSQQSELESFLLSSFSFLFSLPHPFEFVAKTDLKLMNVAYYGGEKHK